MATYFFRNVGGNTSVASNWSLSSGGPADGAVPTGNDNANFDANSGNATVNADLTMAALNFTGYANTITMNAELRPEGNVTLSPTMTVIGTGALRSNNQISAASRTWTANGKTWGLPIIIGNTNTTLTTVFADNWSVSTFTTPGISIQTLNGPGTITVTGNLVSNGAPTTGSTTIIVTGACSIISTVAFGVSLTINSSGAVTISSTFTFGSGTIPTFTYTTAASISSGVNITWAQSAIINAAAITWGNMTFSGNNGTYTLSANLTVSGNLDVSSSLFANSINGFNIYVSGNLTNSIGSGLGTDGTTTIQMVGTGTWSGSGTLRINLNINSPSGTITVSGTVGFGLKTLTYTSANSLVLTGSTLNISSAGATINTPNINWVHVSTNGGTVSLSADLNITGNYTNVSGATTFNSANVYLGGNVTISNGNVANGTATLIYNGTGTWSTGTGGPIQEDFVINTTGTLTISGGVGFNTSTLTYTAGTVIATGSTLSVAANTTLNTNGMTWDSIAFGGTIIVTISSALSMSSSISFSGSGATITLNGSTISVGGGTSHTAATVNGNSKIIFNGSGTINSNLGLAVYAISFDIDTVSGTYNLGSFTYSVATFTYVKGVVVASGTTTLNSACTMNTVGMLFDVVTVNSVILASDMNVNGALSASTVNGAGFSINAYGSSISIASLTGTGAVRYCGVSNCALTGAGTNSGNFIFDGSGYLTVSGSITMSGTMRYVRGLVDARTATLNLTGSPSFTDMHKVVFGNITFANGTTMTCNRFFSGNGTYPTTIQPATTGTMTVTVTMPSISEYISVKGVNVSSAGYALRITTRDADKGSNTGNVIFMSGQQPMGLVDEEDYRNYVGYPGFVNQWSQDTEGLVRNN